MNVHPPRRIKVASPQCGEEEAAAAREALLSGNLVSGRRVEAFERAFAAYVGTAEAVAVSNGTVAIQAALAAAGVGPGDEVIVPALTFFSTATAAIQLGAVPVFADISLTNFCLDPEDFAQRITARTRAVIPVHLYGHCTEMDAITAVARQHGVAVIEDCAQSHGTRYRGAVTGSLGDLGCFSFFATKHMTTGGEGGMVTTSDSRFADYIRCFRNHGLRGRDDHVLLGGNYRMTEMEAAIGLVQLGKLEALNESRIAIAQRLHQGLRDVPWLQLPQVPPHVRHTYFWFHILIDEGRLGFPTAELVERLAARGIETRRRYQAPLYRQPLLTEHLPPLLRHCAPAERLNYAELHLRNAERVAGSIIGLPNRPDMSDDEVDYVCRVVRAIA
jgi:dTDP-4-amino-4,6-dideoxygalactose transaminase